MGTSQRRTDEKIKKLLKQKNIEDYEQAIPEVALEVLTRRKITNYFKEKEFEVVLGLGIKGIR